MEKTNYLANSVESDSSKDTVLLIIDKGDMKPAHISDTPMTVKCQGTKTFVYPRNPIDRNGGRKPIYYTGMGVHPRGANAPTIYPLLQKTLVTDGGLYITAMTREEAGTKLEAIMNKSEVVSAESNP